MSQATSISDAMGTYCETIPLPADFGLPDDAVVLGIRAGTHAELLKNTHMRAELASSILSDEERETFSKMRAAESREVEWLIGRCVAKSAVASWLRSRHRFAMNFRELKIAADERGKPFVAGAPAALAPGGISISIAHSRGDAVAVAWGGEHGPAGVDLEFPREMSDALIERSFSDHELKRAGGAKRALQLWCLKEAVAKLTGDGILKGLRELEVISDREVRGQGKIFSTAILPRGDGYLAVASLKACPNR